MRKEKAVKQDGVGRQQMLDLLSKLRPGLASKDVVEQATAFIFKDGFVWSFNDEIAVSHPLPEGMSVDGVAVSGEPLMKFLTKTSADRVSISVNESGDKQELRLTCGKSTAGIALQEARLPVDDIPLPDDKEWKDLPPSFVAAVNLARLACSMDMTTPVLSCVAWTGEQVTACDNYQLTQVVIPKGVAFKETVLLPAHALGHLKQYSPSVYAIKEGWAHFMNDDEVLYSFRTVQGKYPDVSALLKVKGTKVMLPDGLSAALDRAGVFSKAEFTQDEEVLLECSGDSLLVKAQGTVGWCSDELKMNGEVEFTLTVNPAVLQESLRLGSEVLVGKSALMISGKDFKHVVCLI